MTTSFLLKGNDSIRFIPKPNFYWSASTAPYITVKAWDVSTGSLELSSLANVNTNPYINTAQSISNSIGLFSTSLVNIIATRLGCDGVPNSAVVHDACCMCGGSGTGCAGCDDVHGSNVQYDSCDVCGGLDDTCTGCDFVPLSTSVLGTCNECLSTGNVSISFKDCSGTCFGASVSDDCEICSGGTTNHQYNTDK